LFLKEGVELRIGKSVELKEVSALKTTLRSLPGSRHRNEMLRPAEYHRREKSRHNRRSKVNAGENSAGINTGHAQDYDAGAEMDRRL